MHVTARELIAIGYWWSERHTDLPRPADFVDASWDEYERFEVIGHLQHGMVARAWAGPSRCRFCGAFNGSLDFTDGTYVWPEGLAHYLREHDVRLPQGFVDHVHECTARWQDAKYSHEWWLAFAKPRG